MKDSALWSLLNIILRKEDILNFFIIFANQCEYQAFYSFF